MRWAATPDFDRQLVIDPVTIAETVFWLATLPRGVTTSEFLLQSIYFDH
jgi:NADP-dependent 3-hydroxy acid dehydrogenase YdfG